jgi:hypothetical protein
MLRRRRLVPLLTVVLVIQSLVTVLPHIHGPAVDGQVWQAVSSLDSAHHCLACSVHAPVVEPAAEFGHAVGATTTSPVTVDGGTNDVNPVGSYASPRGPPWIS